MTKSDYWRVNLTKAVIGDVKVLTSTDSAIIDTGSSHLGLPEYDMQSLVSLLKSVYGIECKENAEDILFTCPCLDTFDASAELPSALKITLSENNTYEMPID